MCDSHWFCVSYITQMMTAWQAVICMEVHQTLLAVLYVSSPFSQ